MDNENKEPGKLQIFDLLTSATLLDRITSRHAEVATFHVRGLQNDSRVAVKHVLVNGVPAQESIHHEFKILTDIGNSLDETLSRSIPRPLLLLDTEGMIVFTFVAGVPFDRLLRRYANVVTAPINIVGSRALDRHARRIGEWLHAFHTATAGSDQVFDNSDFGEELDALVAKSETHGLRGSTLNELRDEAHRQGAIAAGRRIPTAVTHGDFLPQNILMEDGQPGVVDFAGAKYSTPIYRDLAHFVGYLLILSRKPNYHEKTILSVIREFCEGYQRQLDLSVFRLYVLSAMLRITADSWNSQTAEFTETVFQLLSGVLQGTLAGLIRDEN